MKRYTTHVSTQLLSSANIVPYEHEQAHADWAYRKLMLGWNDAMLSKLYPDLSSATLETVDGLVSNRISLAKCRTHQYVVRLQ